MKDCIFMGSGELFMKERIRCCLVGIVILRVFLQENLAASDTKDVSMIPAARVMEFRNEEGRDQIPIAHAIVAPNTIYGPSVPNYIYDSSSSMEESTEVYRYAAEANPPHFQSCLKSAEHYANPDNLEFSVDRATYYYDRATLSPDHDRQLIHRGLFNLYYQAASKTSNPGIQRDFLIRSKREGELLRGKNGIENERLSQVNQWLTSISSAEMIGYSETSGKKQVANSESQEQMVLGRHFGMPIPEIARGYEYIYKLFYNGRLIYKPFPNSNRGKIELPIAALASPLEGQFDLSGYGIPKIVNIYTGYKKERLESLERQQMAQSGRNAMEIWIVARFMVERELKNTASHLQPIMDEWPSYNPIGIFWTCEYNSTECFDYLTTQSPDELSYGPLSKKWEQARNYKNPGESPLPLLSMSSFYQFRLDFREAPTYAFGHEDTYRRFIDGKIFFHNGDDTSQGRQFLFHQFGDSLEGEFDLTGLTNCFGQKISDRLRIRLGYRREVENEKKITIWIVPKFLVDQSSSAFRGVKWKSDLGIFWTWGKYGLKTFDYLTSWSIDRFREEESITLFDCADAATTSLFRWTLSYGGAGYVDTTGFVLSF
ncbi:MAG TPA: hypothetical protein DCP55_05965 [Chitinophagaceae bacterium]|nr:hypothetical protein [Chitinophagaceae bacterium]